METSFAGGCVGRLNGRPDWLIGAPPSRKLSTLARSNQQLTRSAVGCAVPHHAVLIPVPPVECRPPGERSVLPTLLLVPPLRHRARRQQKETAKVPVGAESGVDCLQPRLLPREHHPREGNGGTTVHRCMHARRTHKASLLSVCRSLGCCLELWRAWTVRYNAGDAFAAYIPRVMTSVILDGMAGGKRAAEAAAGVRTVRTVHQYSNTGHYGCLLLAVCFSQVRQAGKARLSAHACIFPSPHSRSPGRMSRRHHPPVSAALSSAARSAPSPSSSTPSRNPRARSRLDSSSSSSVHLRARPSSLSGRPFLFPPCDMHAIN